ncbi:MAG: hypothetical protein IJ125_04520 [Atopobiaceae bacterium]|nr:hypothetical protein [Atopobiaceae bacterium]
MKISSFSPMIISPRADEIIALFEDLGFQRAHTKEGIENDITAAVLKNESGFMVTVVHAADLEEDMSTIRMNVDNFDEAYEMLLAHGFTNPRGDRVTETPSSKAAMVYSPSGFTISVAEHIKK